MIMIEEIKEKMKIIQLIPQSKKQKLEKTINKNLVNHKIIKIYSIDQIKMN